MSAGARGGGGGGGVWEKVRPARTLLFSLFFSSTRPTLNPDWSDLIDYLIHPSDWSATCHSKPLRSYHIYI